MEMCNLSMAVARADDTPETLRDKVEIATIIGTIQSMATDFKGLRPEWKANCEQERLLGVDITGQLDCSAVQDTATMQMLRDHAVETNRVYAEKLGINQSAAVTCVKPSGNSSQLLDCASGLHARHSAYYIRNVRVGGHSPLYSVLRDAGVAMVPENGQSMLDATTWVVGFPVKAPDGAITREDRSALVQLDYWLLNKRNWTEHTASCTIVYKPNELDDIIDWVHEHQDEISGLSFLPMSDAQYDNMPYVAVSKEEYEKAAAVFPVIDFARIYLYEQSDMTEAASEIACSSGLCELV